MLKRMLHSIAPAVLLCLLVIEPAQTEEPTKGTKQRIELLKNQVEQYKKAGDYENQKKAMIELAEAYHAAGNRDDESLTYYMLQQSAWQEGDFQLSVDVLEKSYAAASTTESTWMLPLLRQEVGFMKIKMGRLQEGRHDIEKALELSRQSGDKRMESNCLHNLSWEYVHLGDMKTAFDLMARAQAIRKESDSNELKIGVFDTARLTLLKGDVKAAEDLYRSSISGEKDVRPAEREFEIELLMEQGKFADAEALGRQILKTYKEDDLVQLQFRGAILLARALGAQGKRKEAADILLEVEPGVKKIEAGVALEYALYRADFAGDSEKSPERLDQLMKARATIQQSEFVDLQMKARLLLGKAELSCGRINDGISLLQRLQTAASASGFGLIADKAATLLKTQ